VTRLALLLALLAPPALAADAAPSPTATSAGPSLLVSFLEPGGRIKIADQKLPLALDAKPHDTALTQGGSLEGFRLRLLSRPVNVNGVHATFVELTILGKGSSEAGYLTATFPDDDKGAASASTKFKGAKGDPLAAVITRPPAP